MVEDWNENEWTEEMKKLSIEEIDAEMSSYCNMVSFLRDLKSEKQANELPYCGKYIKIYDISNEEPFYMKCDTCKLTHDLHVKYKTVLWFKGVGFRGSFGPYEDSNYVDFSTWQDRYLDWDNYSVFEGRRESGDLKEGDYDYNHYSVVIITKEEFKEAFHKMVDGMNKAFNYFADYE